MDRAKSALGNKPKAKSSKSGSKSSSKSGSKSGSKKPDSVHIKRGASGGFIATHHSKPKSDGSTDPKDHAVSDMAQLQAHLQDALGDQPPQQAAPQPPTEPDPSMAAQPAGASVAAAPPQSTMGPGM